jgi:hypothetical protein
MAILNFRQRVAPGSEIAGAPPPDAIDTEADAKGA